MNFSPYIPDTLGSNFNYSKDKLNNIISIITISILYASFYKIDTLIKLFINYVLMPGKLYTAGFQVIDSNAAEALNDLWAALSILGISLVVLGVNYYIKDRKRRFRLQCNVLLLVSYYIVLTLIYVFIYNKEISWVVKSINFQVIIEYSILFIMFSIIIAQQRQNKLYNDNLILLEEKKQIELQSLKQSIKPDLFIDTLDTLNTVIEHGDECSTLEFIESMSYVYRYILENDKNEIVDLTDELKFAEHYCELAVKRSKQHIPISFDYSRTENYSIIPFSTQSCIECTAALLKNPTCKISEVSVFLQSTELHLSIKGQDIEMTDKINEILKNLSDRFRSLTECESNALFDSNHLLIKLPVHNNDNI